MLKTVKMKKRLKVVLGIAFVFTTYLLAHLLVFDLRQPAYAFDQEEFQGKQVVYGPRPHIGICQSAYDEVNFDGSEWPFVVFYPFCRFWISWSGYSAPQAWR